MDQITSRSWPYVSVARAHRRLQNARELLGLIENTNLDCSITVKTVRGPTLMARMVTKESCMLPDNSNIG